MYSRDKGGGEGFFEEETGCLLNRQNDQRIEGPSDRNPGPSIPTEILAVFDPLRRKLILASTSRIIELLNIRSVEPSNMSKGREF